MEDIPFPVAPTEPCLLQLHEKVLLIVLLSNVIGIVKVPESAPITVPEDTLNVILDDVFATVILLAFVIVPII